ncbi:MAG TPA: YihY/virulence factor BrkB family protein [Thermomicrobiales bacterium]|jgi:membrane protein|nr:hypothetical protein [Chloroflexota bacterium]HCG30390.1 hypothetical protein [Chloroflexota bacterium]HQX63226.1 YihY/virulence factor BrkB family protein [Thermomicrobiales bacterium]HQZ88631.1 YihY/virulence factor BrkB family protein [Thermomicrobiales bacterium]HRA30927.1 YihY/virulence factor BrkB family protein [Thermomicrobiales bacterium]
MRRQDLLRQARTTYDRAASIVKSNLIYRAANDFLDHDGTIYAAAITFYTLLSIVPFVIFAVAVLGFLIRDPVLQQTVTDRILGMLPADANLDEPVAKAVASVANTESSLVALTAIVAAGWTASGMFGALRRALNRAFVAPARRSLVTSRLVDLGSMIVLVLLLLTSTLVTITLSFIRARSIVRFDFVWSSSAWSLAFFLLPALLSFAVFLLAYRWVPSHSLNIRHLWPGALLAAVGFEVLKIGFSWYVAKFANYDAVYGALGGLISFMAFIYMAAALVIFAAELSREMAGIHEHDEEPGP